MNDLQCALPGGAEGPKDFEKKVWRVIYVKARHEKCVCLDLTERGIESYLPLRKEIRQWSDRKKWIETPLFSCYVFARTLQSEFQSIYTIDGFVKFVSSNGKPSIVPDNQIEDVKRLIEYHSDDIDVLEGDYSGYEAEVVAGPLMGLRGKVVELVNGKNFVVSVDGLDKLLSIKVPAGAVRLISRSTAARKPRSGMTAVNLTSSAT